MQDGSVSLQYGSVPIPVSCYENVPASCNVVAFGLSRSSRGILDSIRGDVYGFMVLAILLWLMHEVRFPIKRTYCASFDLICKQLFLTFGSIVTRFSESLCQVALTGLMYMRFPAAPRGERCYFPS